MPGAWPLAHGAVVCVGLMPDDESISNRSSHIHHYVLKGSGLSCYAECDVLVRYHLADAAIPESYELPCGEKLAGNNGPIVGSKAKVEKAIEACP